MMNKGLDFLILKLILREFKRNIPHARRDDDEFDSSSLSYSHAPHSIFLSPNTIMILIQVREKDV